VVLSICRDQTPEGDWRYDMCNLAKADNKGILVAAVSEVHNRNRCFKTAGNIDTRAQ
jgi:hypothetical protein